MQWDWAVQFQNTGPRFRQFRKVVQASLQPKLLRIYNGIAERESYGVLASLLDNPPNKFDRIQQCVSLP